MIKITARQRELMEHALGGKTRDEWRRNHIAVDQESTAVSAIEQLEEDGLMESFHVEPRFSSILFKVTEKGKAYLESTKEPVKPLLDCCVENDPREYNAIDVWIEGKKRLKELEDEVDTLLKEANKTTLPSSLRTVTAEDLVVGNIIWYEDGDAGPFWNYIEEVHDSNDGWVAYTAEDGRRYGLNGAFVEVK